MRRREFITMLGGAAISWPLAVNAQQAVPNVVGVLAVGTAASNAFRVSAVRQGLSEMGFAEGRNISLELRWAGTEYERLPALAAELVDLRPAVILAIGGTNSALAAKRATTSVPIVFMVGGDPVAFGLVDSFNRPGGNVTGISYLGNVLIPKYVEILHHMLPPTAALGLLLNPGNVNADTDARMALEAAQKLAIPLVIAKASSEPELETTFATFTQNKVGGFLVVSDVWLNNQRNRLIALAAQHGLPAIYTLREFAVAGGLMSYGASVTDAYRQAGAYAGRVLKGEKPSDLPVQQAAKVEFIINMKTAKSLGLDIAPTLLARADEVIE